GAVRMRRFRAGWRAELPGGGYPAVVLGLSASAAPIPAATAVSAGERTAENEHLRLTINDDGALDVQDKRTGTLYRRCAALEDVGDVGDEYNYSPPRQDAVITSDSVRGATVRRLAGGPLRAAFEIRYELTLPAAATADRSGRS